jgi:hypothetical protein
MGRPVGDSEIEWVGHLVWPIMGVFALFWGRVLLFYMSPYFFHMPTSEWVLPTSEWVILTSEGVINAKQAILREFKGLFCTYQHVANTKNAPKCTFCSKNDLFCDLALIPCVALRAMQGRPGKNLVMMNVTRASSLRVVRASSLHIRKTGAGCPGNSQAGCLRHDNAAEG